jgi:hypothetical protein
MARSIQNLFITFGLAAISSACSESVDLGEIEAGDNATNPRSQTPMGAPFGLARKQIGMCALDGISAVSCWVAGDPQSVRRASELGSPVRLAGSEGYLCGIQSDGALVCSHQPPLEPPLLVSRAGRVKDVAVGDHSGCVLTEAGEQMCWRLPIYHPETHNVNTQLKLVPLPGPALWVSHADTHACAVLVDGRVFCHGTDDLVFVNNMLVLDIPGSHSAVPVELPGITDAEQVTVTLDSTCVLRRSGTITCFDSTNMIGLGAAPGRAGSREIVGLGEVTQIASSHAGTCALTVDGALYCWGTDECGAWADRSGPCSPEVITTPALVFVGVKTFAADGWHLCATTLENEVWCRGSYWDPEMGWVAKPGNYRVPL